MHHIIYKTTNLVNGKIYIGYHFQANEPMEFDGYLGSGKNLIKAIKKYGSDKFIRETLFVYDTEEDALAKERAIIDESFVNREDTYNLTIGGGIPPSAKGKPKSAEHRLNIGLANKGKIVSQITKDKLRKSLLGRKKPAPVSIETRKKLSEALMGHKHTEEAKLKMSLNHKDTSGINNPCYGLKGSAHPAFGTKRKRVICPHCEKDVAVNVAKAFHYDKCKFKKI